jgi:hypothetical protein
MESPRAAEGRLTPDAAEFVRFCYGRRSVGWPDLYDEMCLVASRGFFRGWSPVELAEHGIGFGLFELPALAALAGRIVAEEQAIRRAGGTIRVTVEAVAEGSAPGPTGSLRPQLASTG